MNLRQTVKRIGLSSVIMVSLGGCGHKTVPIRAFDQGSPYTASVLSLQEFGNRIQFA